MEFPKVSFYKIAAFVLVGFFLCTQATPLGDLAASLKPGEWGELSTNNIVPAITNTGGASGFTFGYTEDIKWDPTSKNFCTRGVIISTAAGGMDVFWNMMPGQTIGVSSPALPGSPFPSARRCTAMTTVRLT